jgi:hypothetical protein
MKHYEAVLSIWLVYIRMATMNFQYRVIEEGMLAVELETLIEALLQSQSKWVKST